MFTYRSKITLGLKIHLPKPANRTRSIRHSHWLATTAVLAIAFAAAMFVYSIGPATNDREVRAQDGNAASTDVTIQFSGTSAQIDNLPNYDTYYLRLRAENSAGNSPWSGFAVIVNDATGQATSTPAATATQAPVATATQEPAPTATQEPAPTATPTRDPSIIAPPPGSCHNYLTGTSGASGRAPEECDYPKLGVGLEWRVCDYEASLNGTDGRGAKSQPDLAVERIPVFIFPTEDVEPTGISEWIAERETGVRYVVPPYDVYSQWLVIWDAPISLLGPLSRRSDVAAIELVPQPLRDAQSSSNSGWVPTNAPSIHGAGLWQNNTPAVDGTGVKVGIIDSGFDGIQELLRSKGITATPTVNCVFDDDPNNDEEFFCEPGLHGESHEAHGAHVAEALLSIAPNVDLYLARAGGFQTVEKATKWLMTELADPVDVINVSLGYHFDSGSAGEPDNDESVLASVATAVAGGAVWVNSAGNRAQWKNVFHVDVPNAPNEYSSQWDNDWLQMDDGIDFVPVELEQSNADVKFRLRWGDRGSKRSAASPPFRLRQQRMC